MKNTFKTDTLDHFQMGITANKGDWAVLTWVHYDHRDGTAFVTHETFNKIKKISNFKGVDVRVGGKDLIMLTDLYIFRI